MVLNLDMLLSQKSVFLCYYFYVFYMSEIMEGYPSDPRLPIFQLLTDNAKIWNVKVVQNPYSEDTC